MNSSKMRRLATAGTLLAACLCVAAYSTSLASASTARSAAATHTVNIMANPSGMLKFTQSSIKTTPGKAVIVFTNKSPLPHDVVLINSKNKVLGKTPIFAGGTKSFDVTLTAGKYTYYCSVPGHRAAGMQGTLTVS
jgi:plastocyanin